jgi:hypothetical protein
MLESNAHKNQELDRAAKLVLTAATASDSDTEAAASSPFLFTRVRAAINDERRRREEVGWLSLIQVAWRAVPAMALVAILAAVLTVWSTQTTAPPVAQADDDQPLIGALDPGVEQTVLTSRNGLSRDEVFNIVLDRNYGANGK